MLSLALLTALAAVALWGALNWARAVRRLAHGLPLVPPEPRRHVPWGLIDLALVLGVFIGLALLAGVIARRFAPGLANQLQPDARLQPGAFVALVLADSASKLATVAVATLLLATRHGLRLADFGWNLSDLGRDLRLGAVAFSMLAPPVYLLQLALTQFWPSEHPLLEMLREHASPALFALAGLSAVVTAPLSEEWAFRGVLQGWLEKLATFRGDAVELLLGRPAPFPLPPPAEHAGAEPVQAELVDAAPATAEPMIAGPASRLEPAPIPAELAKAAAADDDAAPLPPLWPLVASAVIFAVMHIGHGPDFIPLVPFALGLGYLYRQTHRLTPSIVVHFLLNAVSLAVLAASLRDA